MNPHAGEETKEGETGETKPAREEAKKVETEGVKEEDAYEADRRKEREAEEAEDARTVTLDQFLAGKKNISYKKEARKPEEVKKTNIEKAGEKHKTETLVSQLKAAETYNVSVA